MVYLLQVYEGKYLSKLFRILSWVSSLVFFPKQQTKTTSDTIRLGAYVVFSDTSIIAFSGAHLNIKYDNNLLELDSLAPGWVGPGSLTDSNKTTPLFTYVENQGVLDLYAYYLSTADISIDSLTHIAEIWFKPKSAGTSVVSYDTSKCCLLYTSDAADE